MSTPLIEEILEQVNNNFHDDTPISLEVFEQTYDHLEDEFIYEWVDGRTMKILRDMNRQQYLIIRNLQRFFYKLNSKNEIKGELITEGDNFFNGNRRRPDVAFYTNDQINTSHEGGKTVPEFVIEIASKFDTLSYYLDKVDDYMSSGVKVVWIIDYRHNKVITFRPDNKIEYLGINDYCSAEEVIENFNILVDNLFKKVV